MRFSPAGSLAKFQYTEHDKPLIWGTWISMNFSLHRISFVSIVWRWSDIGVASVIIVSPWGECLISRYLPTTRHGRYLRNYLGYYAKSSKLPYRGNVLRQSRLGGSPLGLLGTIISPPRHPRKSDSTWSAGIVGKGLSLARHRLL